MTQEYHPSVDGVSTLLILLTDLRVLIKNTNDIRRRALLEAALMCAEMGCSSKLTLGERTILLQTAQNIKRKAKG